MNITCHCTRIRTTPWSAPVSGDVRDQTKGGNMKKNTLVLVAFAMTLLMGCIGEKAEDTEKALEGAKAG